MLKAFHENLSRLRKQRRFSQKKVAAELGVSQALLSHYENGAREPGLDFVCRVSTYYGVSTDTILGRVDAECEAKKKQFFADMHQKLDAQMAQLEEMREMIKLREETNSDR